MNFSRNILESKSIKSFNIASQIYIRIIYVCCTISEHTNSVYMHICSITLSYEDILFVPFRMALCDKNVLRQNLREFPWAVQTLIYST